MSTIYAKKPSWLRTPTAWEQSRIWRQRRAVSLRTFQRKTANFLAGIAAASSDQISGTAMITAQMAASRIREQANAKLDKAIASAQGAIVDTKA